MTSEEVISVYQHICTALAKRFVAQAFALIDSLQQELQEWWVINRKEELEDIYRQMLRYQFSDVEVPQQKEVYHRLLLDIYRLADKIKEELLSRNSSQYEYLQKRFRQIVVMDMSKVVAEIVSYSAATASHQATVAFEQNLLRLFNHLWLTDSFSLKEWEAINALMSDKEINSLPKCIAVSAIMLNLLRLFNSELLMWLLDQAIVAQTEVRQRILVSIVLAISRYGDRFEVCDALRSRLQLLLDDSVLKAEITSILFQLIGTSETASITQHIREEILPDMIRFSPRIKDKLEQMDDVGEYMTSDLQEMFEDAGLSEKLQEFSELQTIGADVYVSTFAPLKGFSFFNDPVNWFMPFTPDNSQINELFKGNLSFLEMIMQSTMLCNSDKYSFCLSLCKMSEGQRELMVQSMQAETAQMKEMQEQNMKLTSNVTAKSFANQYVQDIYRFYTLFHKHKDFTNPLEETLAIYETPVFSVLFPRIEEKRQVADFYFAKSRWQEALDILVSTLSKTNIPIDVLEKLGYCNQKTGRFNEAIDYYSLADIRQPDRKWVLSRLSYCYKQVKDYPEALDCLERLLNIQDDNIKALRQMASIYMEIEQYNKALLILHKIDYLAPKTPNIGSMLAWCTFLSGDIEQAEARYEKLTADVPQAVDCLNAGHVAWVMNDIRRAYQHYRLALSLMPSQADFIKAFSGDISHLLKHGISEQQIAFLLDAVLLKCGG
ncbi:MAG: hypothetical protein LBS16_04080 [Prevotellaceae bacterium]|jgi:tetratricopeptide (TPR) repeat protein|nr:hypothetical protein [Prevotellaceae bacterium]